MRWSASVVAPAGLVGILPLHFQEAPPPPGTACCYRAVFMKKWTGFRGFFKISRFFLEICTTKKRRVDPTLFHTFHTFHTAFSTLYLHLPFSSSLSPPPLLLLSLSSSLSPSLFILLSFSSSLSPPLSLLYFSFSLSPPLFLLLSLSFSPYPPLSLSLSLLYFSFSLSPPLFLLLSFSFSLYPPLSLSSISPSLFLLLSFSFSLSPPLFLLLSFFFSFYPPLSLLLSFSSTPPLPCLFPCCWYNFAERQAYPLPTSSL